MPSDKATYAHTTSIDNLRNILSGERPRIRTLKQLAQDNPDLEVSVQPTLLPYKETMTVAAALDRMQGVKPLDRVFVNKEGYLPSGYGDVVITKRLSNSLLKRPDTLNTIPEEYTIGRALSLRNNARVYVPDGYVHSLKGEYPGVRFYPKSLLELPPYGKLDRARAFVGKLGRRLGLNKEAAAESPRKDAHYKRLFGRNASLVGSEALGIAVPGSSDIDVFVPYQREGAFNKALQRMEQRYPTLVMNEVSKKRPDKKTFTGTVNGTLMDVVLAKGPKAQAFADAFKEARTLLDSGKLSREEIITKKQALKSAWFFPETRYKRYKKRVAAELGLAQNYF